MLPGLLAALERRKKQGPVAMGHDIEFLFVSNGKPNMARTLLDMYDALGVRYTHIIRKECKRWSWRCKVLALHDHFMAYKDRPTGPGSPPLPTYFAVTDLGDVLLAKLPVDGEIIAGLHEAYGDEWELLIGSAIRNHPANAVFARFEESVNPWSKTHHFGQSAVFGKLATAARYWAEMLKSDVQYVGIHLCLPARRLHARQHATRACASRALHFRVLACRSLARAALRHTLMGMACGTHLRWCHPVHMAA